MLRFFSGSRAVALSTVVAALVSAPAVSAQAPQRSLLVRDVRVFDGTRMLEHRDVLVERGVIAAISERRLPVPSNGDVVDGQGRTLLPGLIDAHTHAFGDALREAVQFGVTTELDMFTDHNFARARRAEEKNGDGLDRADIRSAGTLVTAPKGHGTEYGMQIPTISTPNEAQAFVDARIAEGSDFIKIVYDDGKTYGMTIATLDKATMTAVVAAAHKRSKLAVVHVGSAQGAREAIEAGADGLVHLFVDRDPDPDFARLVASKKAFVIPTMTVLVSITGSPGAGPLAEDPRFAPYLTAATKGLMTQGFPNRPGRPPMSYAAAEKTVRALNAAGVNVLAGTDAANPGTAHGAAIHRELELLVKAGLTPAQALAAATSLPAKLFKLDDRGRIATGLRGDLVLVKGDPSADILATRDIEAIWKRGARIDREGFAKTIASAKAASSKAPDGLAAGVITDFERGAMTTSFGTSLFESTDSFAGGKSTVKLEQVDGGAEGSAKAFSISGVISDAVPFAWSGVMWSPGAQMMGAADLSSKKEIRFWTKGDGKTYQLMVFAESKGFAPMMTSFVAGESWTEVVVPWTTFGIDGKGVTGIVFAGGPRPTGTFAFQIDNVRLK